MPLHGSVGALSFLLLGGGIGLAAGISPGPVLTLVLSETLRHGWLRGAAVAAGPLLADGPIILIALIFLRQLPNDAVRAVSLAGGVFLLCLAAATAQQSHSPRSLRGQSTSTRGGLLRGLLARALSPHPYLFWFLVGAPLLLEAAHSSPLAAAGYLLGYYSTIVGSNVIIALALHPWAGRLSERTQQALLLVSAAALASFGLLLLARAAGRG